MDELKAIDPFAVRPATVEVRLSVDAIVERTGEMEVVGDQRLDRRAVLFGVGLVARAGDRTRIGGHRGLFLHARSQKLGRGLKRLVEVGDDVLDVLKSDGKAHGVRASAGGGLSVSRRAGCASSMPGG